MCTFYFPINARHCHSHTNMVVGFATTFLPVQSEPITTNIVSSNPSVGEMYSIQHYVIKFVSLLLQIFQCTLVFSTN